MRRRIKESKGASDYNWLIPALYLNELVASATEEIPEAALAEADNLFSTGIAAPIADEIRREDSPRGQRALIKHKNTMYLIPVNGGPYHKSIDDHEWIPVGLIAAETEYPHLPYFEDGELRFLYSGENKWRVYSSDKVEHFAETKRYVEEGGNTEYAVLNAGDTSYLVPISGGKVHRLSPYSQRVHAGTIEVGELIRSPMA